jgi:hypothetical protein
MRGDMSALPSLDSASMPAFWAMRRAAAADEVRGQAPVRLAYEPEARTWVTSNIRVISSMGETSNP